jgi:hypothetical protein
MITAISHMSNAYLTLTQMAIEKDVAVGSSFDCPVGQEQASCLACKKITHTQIFEASGRKK